MPYILEECKAGNTIEIRKYYTPRINAKGGSRIKNLKPTKEAMKKVNYRKAERELRRLMNHNFTKQARHITLTFDSPPTLQELQTAVTKYIRKLRDISVKINKEKSTKKVQKQKHVKNSKKRKNTKKVQSELKYIYVLGAGPVRRHAHILIQGLSTEELEDAWSYGHVNVQRCYSDDLRKLAAYFMRNAEDTRNEMEKAGLRPGRRWNASRNLKKPKAKKKIIQANEYRAEAIERKGYYVDKESVFEGISAFTGLAFYEYTLIREGPRCG
jgi:hypothetical protein